MKTRTYYSGKERLLSELKLCDPRFNTHRLVIKMDTPVHQEKTALEDQIINSLMPSLINHATNVKGVNSMIDTLETTIDELMLVIKESKPKDDSDKKTLEHILRMTTILKKVKKTFQWQDESLQGTHENMLKQIETCFAMLDVNLNLDEQRLQGKNPTSKEKKGLNNAKEEIADRSSDASEIHTNKVANSAKKSVQALIAEKTNLQENAGNTAKMIQHLKAENTKQKDQIQHLLNEIDCFYPKVKSHNRQTTTVQVFYQRKGGMIDSVQKELTSVLAGYLHSVQFERCEHTDDINQNKILLVLCINASRLGTEAANAIEGIKDPENALLLIFHHKNVHALTRQETTTSGKCLTAQCFKKLGGIFDFAFQSGEGIYECKMNENAISAVVSFIRLHTEMK